MNAISAPHEPLDSAPPVVLDPLLDIGELAAYLGVPVSTIYGGHVKFALSDVRDWIAQHREAPAG